MYGKDVSRFSSTIIPKIGTIFRYRYGGYCPWIRTSAADFICRARVIATDVLAGEAMQLAVSIF